MSDGIRERESQVAWRLTQVTILAFITIFILSITDKDLEELLKNNCSESEIKKFEVNNSESCLACFKFNNLTGMLIFLFIFSFNL